MKTKLLELPLGSHPVTGGIGFKVWAPNADAVSVVGNWNKWDPDAAPMERDEGGNWGCICGDASVGDEYKFRIFNGDQSFDRVDPRAREMTNSAGNGVIYIDDFDWEDDNYTLPPNNELVVYELHARTFSLDGSEPDKPIFLKLVSKLDYLRDLGVNVIELMPVAEFAGDLSWGYNPAHVFAVESSYGGPDALKTLVKEAHRRGIGVVLDVVYNHFGPSDLDLWQFDGWSENEMGGIYFYNDWKAETPWGQTRPDYGRGEVRQFIRDNAMMWLTEFHIDGLRYDMTLYIRSVRADGAEALPEGFELIRWINGEARSLPGRKFLIAEDLQNEPYLTASLENGGGGFHAQWDAAFVHPIRDVLIQVEDSSRSMQAICDALHSRFNGDAFQRIVYIESHDEVSNGKARITHEIDSDNETGFHASARAAIGACLVLTAPGVPMLFQGQEFLEGAWFSDDKSVDWARMDQAAGMVRLLKDLIAARLNRGGRSWGLTGQGLEILHCSEAEKVICYHRWREHGPGDDVVVIVNLSAAEKADYQLGFPAVGRWKCLLNGAAASYHRPQAQSKQGDQDADPDPYDSAEASVCLTIAPYSFQIFTLDGDS